MAKIIGEEKDVKEIVRHIEDSINNVILMSCYSGNQFTRENFVKYETIIINKEAV